MTKFAQILSVVVAGFSLLFMALMLVVTTGGTNWRAIADDMEDYAFEAVVAETTRWSVTHRVTGTAVITADTLPGAIVAALNDRSTRLDAKIETATEQRDAIRRRSDRVDEFRQIDEPGIERGLELVRGHIAETAAETVRLTREIAEAAESAAATREVIEARRADSTRLSSALAQVRAQSSAYATQNRRLEDRLVRIRGELNRATERSDALRSPDRS